MNAISQTEAAAAPPLLPVSPVFPEAPMRPQTSSAARRILAASSALGIATGFERGLGFAANLLAARIGGAGVFGAYSLALTTANNLASYAGGGIGSTATRFSGEHAEGSSGYAALVRALALIGSVSAILATLALAAGARPLAERLLGNPELAGLLRWAALSAGAMVLMECCRGFFVGQRRYSLLLLLSGVAGAGLLIGLPVAARFSPTAMVLVQASVLMLAVAVCGGALLLRSRKVHAGNASRDGGEMEVAGAASTTGPMIKQVWGFGMVQLAGVIGLNAAGWWVASLVARADTTLVAMGVFAAANQLRNMASLAPGLLTQSSYAMLAGPAKKDTGRTGEGIDEPHGRVLVLCSLGANLAAIAIAGAGILILPWALPLLYGKSFHSGLLAGSFALATAIVHMGATATAARLSIVSLRASGIINAIWAVLVVVLATRFVPAGGAAAATGLYLATHLVSAVLVLLTLRRAERLPAGLVTINLLGLLTACILAGLAIGRELHPEALPAISFVICAVVAGSLFVQLQLARRQGWVPHTLGWSSLRSAFPGRSRRDNARDSAGASL